MIPLLLFVALGLLILVLYEWRARHQSPQQREQDEQHVQERQRQNIEGECCGRHLICEREVSRDADIVYYDDEELDALKGIAAEDYTAEQEAAIREVFLTLQDKDIRGWVESVTRRDIAIPLSIREEVLLVMSNE